MHAGGQGDVGLVLRRDMERNLQSTIGDLILILGAYKSEERKKSQQSLLEKNTFFL